MGLRILRIVVRRHDTVTLWPAASRVGTRVNRPVTFLEVQNFSEGTQACVPSEILTWPKPRGLKDAFATANPPSDQESGEQQNDSPPVQVCLCSLNMERAWFLRYSSHSDSQH